jgi:hypothetical protein
MDSLKREELLQLVRTIFPRLPQDRALGILVDLPVDEGDDTLDWRGRRQLAWRWHQDLSASVNELALERVDLFMYENVRSNNANLPAKFVRLTGTMPNYAEGFWSSGEMVDAKKVFSETQLFLAPTEFSATAPLKLEAKQHGFRAATMPGFSEVMLPALRVDYEQVYRRLMILKNKLDEAEGASVAFIVDRQHEFKMHFDLRFRTAIVSSGRLMESGDVGNLPSGETYIVPYEGEQQPQSRTEGVLPVQIRDTVLLYDVRRNRARSVHGDGEVGKVENLNLSREPAIGNMAELGFGVLADFGIRPCNAMLLDEKLGFHIGFGRSDHFGGFVGENQFLYPDSMVHLDRIYIPACQPRIEVKQVQLHYHGSEETIIKANNYTIF